MAVDHAPPPPLWLASGSPRRRALLRALGIRFRWRPSGAPEGPPRRGESPRRYALRLSRSKAEALLRSLPDRPVVVLAADTLVVVGRSILGKPHGPREAQEMLHRLSGRTHTVVTALTLLGAPGGLRFQRVVSSRVTLRTLSTSEVRAYTRSKEPYDKAGGYAIQGRAGAFVTAVRGSRSCVVGLPLEATARALGGAGYPLSRSALRRAQRGLHASS